MALVKCPECGKEISDTAKNCIHCGYALKEESNTPSQTIINVEAPKKEKSSKNFLVIGITLNLCCLAISTINACQTGFTGYGTNEFREWLFDNNLFIPSIVVAAISLIYSLVLLAVPKLRKVSVVIPYLLVNLLDVGYIFSFWNEGACAFVTAAPQFFALIVSVVLIFISLFIRDEKQ